MIRSIFFDFDGVLADTEPVHFHLFKEILQGEGIDLTQKDYFDRYLGLDDRSCFRQVYADRGRELSPEQGASLVTRKNQLVLQTLRSKHFLLPGVPELLQRLSPQYYLVVVSGALKVEVMEALRGGNEGPDVRRFFRVVVGANDVERGKPDPDGYLLALKWLNRDHVPASEVLLPGECLVVEDSPWGITAGKRAGMMCLALTSSYQADRLQEADRVIHSLAGINEDLLAGLAP